MQISCIPDHFRILDRAALKWIALISMLIDHTALVVLFYGILCGSNTFATTYSTALYGLYRLMRSVGRIAFPLFLFMLVQGFKYTHDRKSYGRHLLIFALLSEIPFNLTVGQSLLNPGYQNVMWTLFFGFLMMCALEKLEQTTLHPLLRAVLCLLVIAATALIAFLCKTDYSYKGILALALMYIFRYDRNLTLLATAVAFCWEPAAIFSIVPLALYNDQKGHAPKNLFYWFYPVHLLVLYTLEQLLLHLTF